MKKEQLVAAFMLVTMKTDNGLRRGTIMFIIKKFGHAHWHSLLFMGGMHELGTINSPELIFCAKKLWKKGYVSN